MSETASAIVEALGRQAIIDRLGVSSQSVSDAISDERFSSRWYRGLKELGDERGIEIPLSAFKWRAPSERAAS